MDTSPSLANVDAPKRSFHCSVCGQRCDPTLDKDGVPPHRVLCHLCLNARIVRNLPNLSTPGCATLNIPDTLSELLDLCGNLDRRTRCCPYFPYPRPFGACWPMHGIRCNHLEEAVIPVALEDHSTAPLAQQYLQAFGAPGPGRKCRVCGAGPLPKRRQLCDFHQAHEKRKSKADYADKHRIRKGTA
jgi:hypothetical protein